MKRCLYYNAAAMWSCMLQGRHKPWGSALLQHFLCFAHCKCQHCTKRVMNHVVRRTCNLHVAVEGRLSVSHAGRPATSMSQHQLPHATTPSCRKPSTQRPFTCEAAAASTVQTTYTRPSCAGTCSSERLECSSRTCCSHPTHAQVLITKQGA